MSVKTSTARTVTVATVQFEPIVGDRAGNLAAIDRLARAAKAQGADIIVLPELADSGYSFRDGDEVAALAGPVPGGASAETLYRLAGELGLYIVSGVAERDGDRFYNSALLCGPEGYIGKYRKLHLWNNENRLFRKGDLGLPVFDLPFGRIGIAICYDGWFPETFRQLAMAGAELVCVPTNWVPMAGAESAPEPMANILHKAAAHTNGLYIACADRIGIERGQPFIGRSLIVGPQGWPISGPASADREEILLAQIDLSSVTETRTLNSFNHLLGDRRADVYG
ncbi:nitrilase family protein (plasmid) [Rhizobium leguminosarum bv. viciae 248]|uniref:nitrilase family protein n=1 Tax=Rhizobium TaxID=379 RepID=UPI00037A606E|nr:MULTISPECIES: nitrilase family protein [Rhizobium]MBY3222111.1 hydratase [Rhizobium laguerreae]MCA2406905.1 nitrilase family protein [Rhizobium leguminosarum]NKM60607.1 hydratase [Rhizobium leguminosarum bv. viciae]QHW28587.1 nitrilase family protein [Rhizobium leguminosarum bv. viciae 248]